MMHFRIFLRKMAFPFHIPHIFGVFFFSSINPLLLFLQCRMPGILPPSEPVALYGRTNYSKNPSMIAAVNAAHRLQRPNISKLARIYKVDRKSLERRVNGLVECEAKTGHVQGLSSEEEEGLVSFLLEMSNRGFGHTRPMIRNLVIKLTESKKHSFSEAGPSANWFRRFEGRHPELSRRVPDVLTPERKKAGTPESMTTYLSLIQDIIKEADIRPEMIWNFDETSLVTRSTPKVYAQKGARVVNVIGQDHPLSVSLMFGISATGEKASPLFIFEGKRSPPVLLEGAPPGSLLAMQENGWMTSDIFHRYIVEFLRGLDATRQEINEEKRNQSY